MGKSSTIIITPFKKALTSLEKALLQPKDEFTRDAVIQRFEYTFELSWKILKRYLELNTQITPFSLKNLFREAAKQGWIDDLEAWLDFIEARNLTSHTYDEETAEETFVIAKKFGQEARKLLEKMEQINEDRS